jgi:hypothetical protein
MCLRGERETARRHRAADVELSCGVVGTGSRERTVDSFR